MIENGPVQLIPWGLGNLLGLKGDIGVLAGQLNALQPSIEMLELLAGPNAIENVTQTVGVNALGSVPFTSLVVPERQAWLVRGVGAAATTLVGELLRYRVLSYTPLNGGYREITPEFTSSLTDAAAVGVAGGSMNVGAFILYGGEAIRPFVNRVTTAGAINLVLAAQILRFSL